MKKIKGIPTEGYYYINQGKKNNAEIIRNGGSHVIVKIKGGESIVFCDKEMGFGLACKIFKWFKEHGLITSIIIGILALIVWVNYL